MRDWNVIVTIKGHQFKTACEHLEPLGQVSRTSYYNVLAVRVDDIGEFLETLRDWVTTYPDSALAIARVAPVTESFTFQSVDEFESKARICLSKFVPQLAGKRFHVRMHRRGWKEKLGEYNEEQFLGGLLVGELREAGTPGEVDFEDPDLIVVIETLDSRAGVAAWSREDLERYPFLKLD